MVTSYQSNRFFPPNNPNLDTRLGLLLFVRNPAKLLASGILPANLCPPGLLPCTGIFAILQTMG